MNEAVPSYRYLSSSATDVGCLRELNEDALLERPEIGLWAVADGMGGHESGDLASRTIVDSLFKIEPPLDPVSFLRDVQWRIRAAHQALLREAAERRKDQTIGSTVVALLVSGPEFTCVWAGDSRLYLFREGTLRQVTRDHSLVQDMVDAGQLDADLADTHPHANVITRAVGAAEELTLDKQSAGLKAGDRLLLCSDGLTRYVPHDEIADILGRTDIAEAAPALVRAALAHKTRDNVSVIVVACEPADDSDDDLADTLPRARGRAHAPHADLEPAPEPSGGNTPPSAASPVTDDGGDAELDRILSDQVSEPPTGTESDKQRDRGGILGRFRPSNPRKD